MKTVTLLIALLVHLFLLPACSFSQNKVTGGDRPTGLLTPAQTDKLLEKPPCLIGYHPNQRGPLTRIDSVAGDKTDSTFTVEHIRIPGDGISINGWLYLPLGSEKVPLIILTNGGGDDSRPIKSLSDWIAPILAHCGYAALVHDKRGTGESGGIFAESTYEDFIRDAGNCAVYLKEHNRIDPDRIGTMGGSEGGLIAVAAASRYPEIHFVISQAGTVVSGIEDRLNAQLNGMYDGGLLNDSLLLLVKPMWIKSFQAWASHDPQQHKKVDSLIAIWRQQHDRLILPFMKSEMDTIPQFRVILPTWNSIGFDYLTELSEFRKPWLAIFGADDRVVPTEASVTNLQKYMQVSGNENYQIAILEKCGHAPVHIETRRMIRVDHMVINWLNQTIQPNPTKD